MDSILPPNYISVDEFNKDTITWKLLNGTVKTKFYELVRNIISIHGNVRHKRENKTVIGGGYVCGVYGPLENYEEKDPDSRYWLIHIFTNPKYILNEDEAQASNFYLDCLKNGKEYILRRGTLILDNNWFFYYLRDWFFDVDQSTRTISYTTYDIDLAYRAQIALDTMIAIRYQFRLQLCREKVALRNLPLIMISKNPNGGKKCICWWDKEDKINRPEEIIVSISTKNV